MIELESQGHHSWLKGVVGSLMVLNMLDGLLTIAWTESGMATEMNPLMNVLLSTNPVLFLVIKTLLVCLGAIILWRFRAKSMAVVSIYICFVAYTCVILYHLGGGIGQFS